MPKRTVPSSPPLHGSKNQEAASIGRASSSLVDDIGLATSTSEPGLIQSASLPVSENLPHEAVVLAWDETTSTHTSATFEYTPLDLDSDAIRVLTILPGPNESLVRCEMVDATIKDSYSCLSYTWEPSNPRHDIEVNGATKSIGHNLYLFLQAARENDFQGKVWVDALCIDQSNVTEKNHQVRRMGDIYKAAVEVHVWLGPLSKSSQSVFFFTMSILEDLARNGWRGPPTFPGGKKVVLKHLDMLPEDAQRELYDCIKQLLSLPYWSRVWTAQEFVNANRLVIYNELGKLPFAGHGDIIIALYGHLTRESSGDPFGFQYMFWHGYRSPLMHPHLLNLLSSFTSRDCLDKRDRIFALLSLVADGHKYTVDYNLGREVLFRRVLELNIRSHDLHLDELLQYGSVLINALELRPPLGALGVDSSENDTMTLILFDRMSEVIIGPVWRTADLSILDQSGESQKRRTICAYVTVYDGPDIHLLEYAFVEETPGKLRAVYARTYEYIRGEPQIHALPLSLCSSEDGTAQYIWVDIPSEDVYYRRGTDDWGERPFPPLHAWSKLHILLVRSSSHTHECSGTSGAKSSSPRKLRPPPRVWDRRYPFTELKAPQRSHIFSSVNLARRLERDIQHQCALPESGPNLRPNSTNLRCVPHKSRLTSVRLGPGPVTAGRELAKNGRPYSKDLIHKLTKSGGWKAGV